MFFGWLCFLWNVLNSCLWSTNYDPLTAWCLIVWVPERPSTTSAKISTILLKNHYQQRHFWLFWPNDNKEAIQESVALCRYSNGLGHKDEVQRLKKRKLKWKCPATTNLNSIYWIHVSRHLKSEHHVSVKTSSPRLSTCPANIRDVTEL